MSTVSMSGNDTIIINNRILRDLADGDCVTHEFPNDLANLKVGKNGNTLYALNQTGKTASTKLKLMRGSADDKFMNGLLATMKQNFAGFPLMFGQFTKKIGDGQGNITSDEYVMSGGVFPKQPGGKDSQEGDVEAATVTYEIKWSNSPRAIG